MLVTGCSYSIKSNVRVFEMKMLELLKHKKKIGQILPRFENWSQRKHKTKDTQQPNI